LIKVRSAAGESQKLIEEMELEVASDQRLFRLVKESLPANEEEARAKELYLVDFELKGGCALSSEAQTEFKELKTEVIEKQGQFSRNIANDSTAVLLSRAELDGLDDVFCSELEKTEEGLFKVIAKTICKSLNRFFF
jgi:Zn-dependent oligopeptidase